MLGDLTSDYLNRHKIYSISDLVGEMIYHVYPSQGIVSRKIRKLEITNKHHEWFIHADCAIRLSELGKTVFLDEDEAKQYQLKVLDTYTKSQKEKAVKRAFEEREKEIDTLNRLLKKYPTAESRTILKKNCSSCKYRDGKTPHTCDICDSLDEEPLCMWEVDVSLLK